MNASAGWTGIALIVGVILFYRRWLHHEEEKERRRTLDRIMHANMPEGPR